MSRIFRISISGSLLLALMVCVSTDQNSQAFERNQWSIAAGFQPAWTLWNPALPSTWQDDKPRRETKQDSKQQVVITKARRNQLMKFVNENHPELKPLINSLRKKRPGQYNAAMRSLDKSITRLNELEKSLSAARYEQVLNDWKLRSRIQLLSARLSIKDTPARREELQRLITERIDNRVSQLNAEVDKTQSRLDRLTELVTELEANRESEIERQFKLAVRSAERIKLARQKKNQASGSQQKDEGDDP